MRFQLIAALTALASLATADVDFTSPFAGASYRGGSAITLTLAESGSSPALTALSSYQLFLCAGSNTEYDVLSTLVSAGNFSSLTSTITIPPTVGAGATNGYFLKIVSTATDGGTVINFSNRFSLTGMTGTFSSRVHNAMSSVLGTSGPETIDDVANIAVRQVAAAAAAAAAATTAAAAAASTVNEFTVAYHLQTGLTKYAPMQPIPGTKITATGTPTPQNPTSSYSLATTYLGSPTILLTTTEAQTWTHTSLENTNAAQSRPTDDLGKFMRRWVD